MYFISPFDFWVLSVQKIEFFCISQSYLIVVEYSTSFARQKAQIIVCWIDYRFVFPPRLLLLFLFASYCICMHFFSGYENSDKFTSKDELRSCIHVAWICLYDFLFLSFVFFLFVCSRSTKDEIFCCSSCLVRFKFFAFHFSCMFIILCASLLTVRFIILYFNCYY